jgi:hypothetical protein
VQLSLQPFLRPPIILQASVPD